jgi:hypothetical protein
VIALLLGCDPEPPAAPVGDGKFVLAYQGGVAGEIEPCG